MAYQVEQVERELQMEAQSRREHAAWSRELIGHARALGIPWERIAECLGLSRATVIRMNKETP